MEIIHKVSREHTRKLMVEYIRTTVAPRLIKEHQNKRDQEQSRQAN